jgi:DNA-binding GntR family transcriptional regulator
VPVRVDEALDNIAVPELLRHPREISSELHTHLRQLINDGVIAPGTELNQADLARRFNVSRIPMREAFRMLQQEGLIDVHLNQRAVVRALDADEVDQLYGMRITLESLGARITAGSLTDEEVRLARGCLATMRKVKRRKDMTEWITVHREFHRLCTARAGEPLARTILSCSERTERYLRFGQRVHPDAFVAAEQEHRQILAALVGGDVHRAGTLMAEHLSHTATLVVTNLQADNQCATVGQALAMSGLDAAPQ